MTEYSSSYLSQAHQNFDTNILDITSINCFQSQASLPTQSCTPINNNSLINPQQQHQASSSELYNPNSFGQQIHNNHLTNSNPYRYESNWRGFPNNENGLATGPQGSISNPCQANSNNAFMDSFNTGFNYKLYSPSIDETESNLLSANGSQRSANSSIVGTSASDKRKQRRIRTTFSSLQLKELEKGI